MSLMVTFILSFLQPFELDEIQGTMRFWVGPAFGAVTLAVMLSSFVWFAIFPQFFTEQAWTLGREFLWTSYHFLAIAAGNYLLGRTLFPGSGIFAGFGPILLVTIVVGLLPYLLITYISHTHHLKRNLHSALALNQQLHPAEETDTHTPGPLLNFTDEEDLLPPIALHDFLFIEAEGNYLNLWVLQNGTPTDYRLRGTLKEQETRLADHPQLLRCHRAYLVNLDQIEEVSGNSAGYRLTIRPELPEVPVSRGQVPTFKAAVEHLHPSL